MRQALLEPCEGQRQRRPMPLKSPRQFGHERAINGGIGPRHVGNDQDQAGGVLFGGLAHGVGPGVGQPTVHVGVGQADGHAAQVLDQRQPHHDGNGPQLAQLQRRYRLVGSHEGGYAHGINARVAVRDHLQRNVVHPGQALGRTAGQFRQAAAVALGQMALGQADLLFDQVEVVQQPFVGGGELAVLLHGFDQQRAGFAQQGLVFIQARQQLVLRAECAQHVRLGQRPAVRFHLHGVEQFRAQRRFALGGAKRGLAAGEQVDPLRGSL
ncbi:hypothetical protein D3C72_1035510 [compost metagenome]